jgi:hypothetical protein
MALSGELGLKLSEKDMIAPGCPVGESRYLLELADKSTVLVESTYWWICICEHMHASVAAEVNTGQEGSPGSLCKV